MKKVLSVLLGVSLVLGTHLCSFAEYKPLEGTHFEKKPTFADVVVDTVDTELAEAGPSRELRMNIYNPENVRGPTPAILYVHGGAWNSGDYTCENLMEKDTGTNDPFFACMRALDMGITVVTADYRLANEALYPAMVWDLKGQIRFLRAHADEYNIDPDKIIVWGQSAGAQLCNILGTTDGVEELEGEVGGNLEYSSKPLAVVDYYGMTDILDLAPAEYLRPHIIDPAEMYKQADAPDSSRSLLIGYTGEDQGLYALRAQMGNPGSPYVNPHADEETQAALHRAYLACPLNFVDKNDVPFVILFGGKDHRVAPSQSYELFEALTKYGIEAYMFGTTSTTHGDQGEFAAHCALRFVKDQFAK